MKQEDYRRVAEFDRQEKMRMELDIERRSQQSITSRRDANYIHRQRLDAYQINHGDPDPLADGLERRGYGRDQTLDRESLARIAKRGKANGEKPAETIKKLNAVRRGLADAERGQKSARPWRDAGVDTLRAARKADIDRNHRAMMGRVREMQKAEQQRHRSERFAAIESGKSGRQNRIEKQISHHRAELARKAAIAKSHNHTLTPEQRRLALDGNRRKIALAEQAKMMTDRQMERQVAAMERAQAGAMMKEFGPVVLDQIEQKAAQQRQERIDRAQGIPQAQAQARKAERRVEQEQAQQRNKEARLHATQSRAEGELDKIHADILARPTIDKHAKAIFGEYNDAGERDLRDDYEAAIKVRMMFEMDQRGLNEHGFSVTSADPNERETKRRLTADENVRDVEKEAMRDVNVEAIGRLKSMIQHDREIVNPPPEQKRNMVHEARMMLAEKHARSQITPLMREIIGAEVREQVVGEIRDQVEQEIRGQTPEVAKEATLREKIAQASERMNSEQVLKGFYKEAIHARTAAILHGMKCDERGWEKNKSLGRIDWRIAQMAASGRLGEARKEATKEVNQAIRDDLMESMERDMEKIHRERPQDIEHVNGKAQAAQTVVQAAEGREATKPAQEAPTPAQEASRESVFDVLAKRSAPPPPARPKVEKEGPAKAPQEVAQAAPSKEIGDTKAPAKDQPAVTKAEPEKDELSLAHPASASPLTTDEDRPRAPESPSLSAPAQPLKKKPGMVQRSPDAAAADKEATELSKAAAAKFLTEVSQGNGIEQDKGRLSR